MGNKKGRTAYPENFKTLVIEAHQSGESYESIARRFKISAYSANSWENLPRPARFPARKRRGNRSNSAPCALRYGAEYDDARGASKNTRGTVLGTKRQEVPPWYLYYRNTVHTAKRYIAGSEILVTICTNRVICS